MEHARFLRGAPRWTVALSLALLLVALLAALLAAACGGDGESDDAVAEAPLPAAAERIELTANDGLSFVAEVWRGGDQWVLLGHMFTADRHAWDPIAAEFQARGLSVLVWDFRCHGESPCSGDSKSDGVKDIWREWHAAIDYALAEGAATLVAIGASMGGTSAAQVAAQRPEIAALALLSSPNRFKGLDALLHYDQVTVPRLIIAGDDDGSAPDAARRFAADAAGPVRLVILASDLHGNVLAVDPVLGPKVQGLLYDFVADPLARTGLAEATVQPGLY